jgi:hypothetical protein
MEHGTRKSGTRKSGTRRSEQRNPEHGTRNPEKRNLEKRTAESGTWNTEPGKAEPGKANSGTRNTEPGIQLPADGQGWLHKRRVVPFERKATGRLQRPPVAALQPSPPSTYDAGFQVPGSWFRLCLGGFRVPLFLVPPYALRGRRQAATTCRVATTRSICWFSVSFWMRSCT